MSKKFIEKAKDKLRSYANYLLILVSLLLLTSLVRNILRGRQASEAIRTAEVRVEKLDQENQDFNEKIEFLRSDEYKESQFRDKLGLAKEGEIVVVLPDDEILRKLAPKRVEEEQTLPDPNWKKWIRLFGF